MLKITYSFRNPAYHMRSIFFFGLMVIAFFHCGSEPKQLAIQLSISSSASIGPFVVTISSADGQSAHISCPEGSPSPALSCLENGILMGSAPEALEVTVKARGFEFANQKFSLVDLPIQNETHQASITLKPLPAFEKNSDYATGFETKGGLEHFKSMAQKVSTEIGPTYIVKFYIQKIKDNPKVYFQNTVNHPLHYTFARDVLGVALSLKEFEKQTYSGESREAMAGSVIYYPEVDVMSQALGNKAVSPTAVTFFPSDDLTPLQALLAHRFIEERLGFTSLDGDQNRVVYLPAGSEQEAQLQKNAEVFVARDALWLLQKELYGDASLQLLNPGLAYGTLRRMSPEELEKSVVSYSDILVLTRLPNSLPIVGGTITEENQTPLAHVNVSARARGTPNIALLRAGEDSRIKPFLGKLVRFEVKNGTFSLSTSTLEEAQSFWKSRHPELKKPPFNLEPKGLPGFSEIGFDDSVSVGAKAANLAEITHILGKQAPTGFAIPFYYYDHFMHTASVTNALCDTAELDCKIEGRAAEVCKKARQLCQSPDGKPEVLWSYMERIIEDPSFKVDTRLREAALDGLRYHMRHIPVAADFAALLNQRLAEIFGSRKARLRSSTNAEDLDDFSGAGLYDSVAAYAQGSKLASDQVRKVWASVWNFRAFEERSFWNIDHLSVRMGVAVNQAFTEEEANGVLITQNIVNPAVAGMYVNVQKGELPVTNPLDGALPEIFSIVPAPNQNIQVVRLRYSSLSPQAPLLSNQEVLELFLAANKIQQHFAPLYHQDPNLLALDLEFKFNGKERTLFVKQARPYISVSLGR